MGGKEEGFMCVHCRANANANAKKKKKWSVRKKNTKQQRHTNTHKMNSALHFIILHLVSGQDRDKRTEGRVYL